MTTYTNRLNKSDPDIQKLGWHIDWYRNQAIDDVVLGQSMENNFVVSGGNLSGASGLNIDIDATVVEVSGVRYNISAGTLGLTGATVNPEETNWIYANSSGVITVGTTPPATTQYCAIGLVDTDVTTVLRTADLRQSDTSGYDTPVENDCINGTFSDTCWQRYAGSPVVISSAVDQFVADRFGNYRSSGSSLVVDQKDFAAGQTLVPGNPEHYHEAVFVTDSTSTEENYHFIRIKDVERYSGKTIAFKFHASVDVAKDIALEATQNFGSGGSVDVPVDVETISLTTAMVKNIVYITFPSISTKTVGTLSYSEFKIWLSAGTSFDANTNSLGNQSGTVNISEVEIYESSIELSVKRLNKEDALTECLPYYIRISGVANSAFGDTQTSGNARIFFPIGVKMIGDPTISYSSISDFRIMTITGAVTPTSLSSAAISGTGVRLTTAATITAGDFTPCTLINHAGGSSGYIAFEREL